MTNHRRKRRAVVQATKAQPRRAWLTSLLVGCASLILVGVALLLIVVAGALQPTRVVMTQAAYSSESLPLRGPSPVPLLAAASLVPTTMPGGTVTLTARFETDTPEPLTSTPTPGIMPPPTLTPLPTLPRPTGPTTPATVLIPDSELVNSPGARDFDLAGFIAAQPGLISGYSEIVYGRAMTGLDAVQFVSTATSIHPRLLLALLEYKTGWLSNPAVAGDALRFPFGLADEGRAGLTAQLIYAANTLNMGYYGYKTRGLRTIQFPDKTKLSFDPDLNPGTVALQYFFAQNGPTIDRWKLDISPEGFIATYRRLFGNPMHYAITPLVPPDLQQPDFQLPFARGEEWILSGGPHGGWDRQGSAWGAVDFAPPPPPDEVLKREGKCYVSAYFARAMAGGVIARARDGAVVLDLDLDGDERTGWTLLYLHIARQDRVDVGKIVQAGAPLGHPSCDGFYLNSPGAHIHIARRYNGEWIATDCPACLPGVAAPDLVMGGWVLRRASRQVSMGWLEPRDPAAPPPGPKVGRIELRDKIYW
jgi:LasA protease